MREQITRALEVDPEDVFEVHGLLDLTGPVGHRRASPATRSCATRRGRRSPSRACSPTRTSSPTCWPRCASGDILLHHPYDSFVDLGRALRRAGGRRPRRARDQADRVPHERRLAARPGADPRRRARQAGGLPGGGQGALRRAREHPVGRARWRRRACTSCTACRRSRRTPSASWSSAARATACATTCTSAPATTTPKTARLYTDFGLLTCDDEIGADVADMFNFLTGFARPRGYRRVLVAPRTCATGIIEEIERTIAAHSEGRPARIRMKMNSLVDRECIQALYRASQAGVQVEINTRGICCLRPGVPGVSENIRVVSIVGRFLEHSRIYAFERDGEYTVYIGSADLMPRNLDTRVELLTPLRDETLRGGSRRHARPLLRRQHERVGAATTTARGPRRQIDGEPRQRAARADVRATPRARPRPQLLLELQRQRLAAVGRLADRRQLVVLAQQLDALGQPDRDGLGLARGDVRSAGSRARAASGCRAGGSSSW